MSGENLSVKRLVICGMLRDFTIYVLKTADLCHCFCMFTGETPN